MRSQAPDSAAAPGLDGLAIFTGTPAFAEPKHVGRPNIGDRQALFDRVAGALERHWLTNDGVLADEFETRVAALTGVEHCVAVSSGTVGLQLVARALGLSGEVIVPSFTFVATAHALRWIGLTPVFAEIDPATHTLIAGRSRAIDQRPHQRHRRRSPLGSAVRRRRTGCGRARTRRRADVRCRSLPRLHGRGTSDRSVRRRRGVQLPRHEGGHQRRGRRDHDRRLAARATAAAHAQLRLLRLGHGLRARDEREAERARRRRWA